MTDSPFPPDRRAAAKRRCDDASPGPWHFNAGTDGTEREPLIYTGAPGIQRAVFTGHPVWSTSDGEFAAAARADLPDALAELDAKESEVARLTARVVELEAELRRVAPYLAMHGVGGYRLERP